MPIFAISKTPRLWQASVAEQLESYLVATPEDRFSCDVAHMNNDPLNLHAEPFQQGQRYDIGVGQAGF